MKTFREFKEYLQERERGINLNRPGLSSGDAGGILRRSKVIQRREEDPLSPSSVADRARRLRDSERRAATLAPRPQPKPQTPKPTGPVTSAQAIRSGSKEGSGPKSSDSTYRDKADTKGTSIGRYLTLAQHRAEVAKRKASEAAAAAK